jgi:hypothetical protein
MYLEVLAMIIIFKHSRQDFETHAVFLFINLEDREGPKSHHRPRLVSFVKLYEQFCNIKHELYYETNLLSFEHKSATPLIKL